MRKTGILLIVLCLLLTGCQAEDVEQLQSQVEDVIADKKEELVASAKQEAKDTMLAQIEGFFADPELADRLGISEDKKEELLQKLKGTVESYDMNAAGVQNFQEQMDAILEQELQRNTSDADTTTDDTEEITTAAGETGSEAPADRDTDGGTATDSADTATDTIEDLKKELQNTFTQFLGKDGETEE